MEFYLIMQLSPELGHALLMNCVISASYNEIAIVKVGWAVRGVSSGKNLTDFKISPGSDLILVIGAIMLRQILLTRMKPRSLAKRFHKFGNQD
jgi:hypothetical protein